jgi:uncharacterized protein (DUF1697 family)
MTPGVGSTKPPGRGGAGFPGTGAARWVALLRAVNLGPRNRVPMADLRTLLEAAGHRGVRTYIASGNVLFESRSRSRTRVAADLERLIAAAFGVETTAIVRTPNELAAVVERHPFGHDTARTHISFLVAEPDAAAVTRLTGADHGPDRVELAGAEVYLHYPSGVQGSRLTAAKLEQLLQVRGTVRTWRTVVKLAELASRPG